MIYFFKSIARSELKVYALESKHSLPKNANANPKTFALLHYSYYISFSLSKHLKSM